MQFCHFQIPQKKTSKSHKKIKSKKNFQIPQQKWKSNSLDLSSSMEKIFKSGNALKRKKMFKCACAPLKSMEKGGHFLISWCGGLCKWPPVLRAPAVLRTSVDASPHHFHPYMPPYIVMPWDMWDIMNLLKTDQFWIQLFQVFFVLNALLTVCVWEVTGGTSSIRSLLSGPSHAYII